MPRILIVDDEFGIAEALTDVLGPLGYATAVAENGRLGLQAVAKEPPDLILLDVMMPVMSGPEMLQALKADARHRDIPVVLMSAVSNTSISRELHRQAAGFLQKPFTYDELMSVLASPLGSGARPGTP